VNCGTASKPPKNYLWLKEDTMKILLLHRKLQDALSILFIPSRQSEFSYNFGGLNVGGLNVGGPNVGGLNVDGLGFP
jgi:hypothetical protein